VAQVTNYTRRVLDFRIEEVPGCAWGDRRLLQLHIRGTAFLWHQVHAMPAFWKAKLYRSMFEVGCLPGL
jgi:tRNA U38,U39,U40 pseudouridine synthase TruA